MHRPSMYMIQLNRALVNNFLNYNTIYLNFVDFYQCNNKCVNLFTAQKCKTKTAPCRFCAGRCQKFIYLFAGGYLPG